MQRKQNGTSRLPKISVVAVFFAATLLFANNTAGNAYHSLYKFTGGPDGRLPESDLVVDSNGILYGTTETGGNVNECDGFGCGTVYKVTPNGDGRWTQSVIHAFSFDEAKYPEYGSLLFDKAGNLYGTAGGGAYQFGSVFELMPNGDGTWSETVIYSFGQDGQNPIGRLAFDSKGKLYGTTYQGGTYGDGSVFQLTPNGNGSWTGKVLHSFQNNGKDGWSPVSGLVINGDGSLFGTTQFGGNAGDSGTVFMLIPKGSGWMENVIYSFNGTNGSMPWATPAFDGAGNLYGTTLGGGGDGDWGNVFELKPNAHGHWTERILHAFKNDGKDGIIPYCALIFDTAGNIYGTTAGGGTYRAGTVFKLEPDADGHWKETVLHSFEDRPGFQPLSGLVFDKSGALYGTTAGDSNTTFGSVFAIAP